jgi:hypothetical protein
MRDRMSKYIGPFIIIAVLTGIGSCGYFMLEDAEKHTMKIEKEYKMGDRVDFGGQGWTITKKYLANEKCYYIYQAHYRAFTIPCEEE